MKKILVFLLCAILLCTMPVVVFAEGESTDTVVEENSVPESESEKTVTEMIVDYVQDHFEEISVIATMILMAFYDRLTRRKLSGSIGTLNNNAITVAEKSETAIKEAYGKAEEIVRNAVERVEGVAASVQIYQDKIGALLDELQNSEEEKKALKEALVRVESYIHTAKLANIEFANELAELLCLSNIPNSRKEELYSRHVKSVCLIEAAEDEGVKADDGSET